MQEAEMLERASSGTVAGIGPALPVTRTTRRRLLGAGLLAGSAITLAACGQTPGAATGSTTEQAKGSALFWQWGVGYVDGFQVMINEYNAKRTGVTINFDPGVVSAGTTNYWD